MGSYANTISGATWGTNNIALGSNAGLNQANNCIAIGQNCGSGNTFTTQSQANDCIAIGNGSGRFGQQTGAIAIGTVCINAGDTALNTGPTAGCYIAPIKGYAVGKGANQLLYDFDASVTGETGMIYYSTN